MKFLYIFCGVVLFLCVCAYKYRNPYKLIFIFGKKGAFKSTYMVSEMVKHVKKGWNVYTNMFDVNIPGVRLMESSELIAHVPDPHSVCFIDEAGLIWDNRNFKSFNQGYTEFFKLQRKYKCKVYVNSQSFDIDKKLRDLTDKMILMTPFAGCIGIIRPIKRSITLVAASSQGESRIADDLKFRSIFSWRMIWGPSYFKYFNSYKAPQRDSVVYSSVEGDLMEFDRKFPVKRLKRLVGG